MVYFKWQKKSSYLHFVHKNDEKTLGVATKNLIIAMNKIAQLCNYEKRSIELEKIKRCRSIHVAKTEKWI